MKKQKTYEDLIFDAFFSKVIIWCLIGSTIGFGTGYYIYSSATNSSMDELRAAKELCENNLAPGSQCTFTFKYVPPKSEEL